MSKPDDKVDKLGIVSSMRESFLEGDYERFKSYLADDLVLRVGATDEVHGPQAVADFFINMGLKIIRITAMEIDTTWEIGDTAIIEYYITADRVGDSGHVTFPCLDIYHFRDAKAYEWHVFPMYRAFAAT